MKLCMSTIQKEKRFFFFFLSLFCYSPCDKNIEWRPLEGRKIIGGFGKSSSSGSTAFGEEIWLAIFPSDFAFMGLSSLLRGPYISYWATLNKKWTKTED